MKRNAFAFLSGSALACSIALAVHPALAAEENDKTGEPDSTKTARHASPFRAEISAGVEYDSNISVEQIDQNTGNDDFAALINADFGYRKKFDNNTSLDVSYNFSQSLYNDFTNFDLQTHFASADLSHDFGGVNVGAAYRFIYTRLGGDGFLAMQQASPYASTFIGKKFFVRVDYTYADKNFIDRADRDAKSNAGNADLYWFVKGVRTYFAVGYGYEKEDAVDPQFDFAANKVKVRFSKRIPMGRNHATFKLGWRFEARDYSSITPSIGVKRNDRRHRLQSELEIPLTKHVFGVVEFDHNIYDSNLPSADYTENVVGARLGFRT